MKLCSKDMETTLFLGFCYTQALSKIESNMVMVSYHYMDDIHLISNILNIIFHKVRFVL